MTRKWRTLSISALAFAAVALSASALGATEAIAASLNVGSGSHAAIDEPDARYRWWGRADAVGQLYGLQASFHDAATLREPNDIDQRIADMLALWADDATLTLGPNTFTGLGEPGTASCAVGSMTICDFFSHVAPPFQNRWISLTPSYKTEIEVHGNNAALDFQCLYFDEDWSPTIRLAVDSTAKRVRGQWKFSSAVVTPIAAPGIPYP